MSSTPLYLALGHICQDIIPGGWKVGGTVSFALRVASVLGCETRLITSATSSFPVAEVLPQTTIHHVPALQNTVFENVQTARGRVQTLHSRALTLEPGHLPANWPTPSIVHLAPIAAEINPAIISAYPHSLIGLTAQGWLRTWDEQGHVTASPWAMAEEVLPRVDVTILSQEDLPDAATLATFRRCAPLLVVTAGAQGCHVYRHGEAYHVPVTPVPDVETTGAGDVFAAAYFIHYHQTHDPLASAHFANQIAAQTVTQSDLEAKIKAIAAFITDKQDDEVIITNRPIHL